MWAGRPRGTNDILPEEAARWRHIESLFRRAFLCAGYGEIRTPVFEHTELFHRSVGADTDIVEKEMYTFTDRGGRSVTLRPEGTAPVVRAYLENGLHGDPQPVKLFYVSSPMFRYDRPQAGRYRQFHQAGAEVFGAADPTADAEVIALAAGFLKGLGLRDLSVRVNSIGCPRCRPAYREALRAYYAPRLEAVCGDCRRRFDVNPLRLLDCKRDRELAEGAPAVLEHLCAECAEHFQAVRDLLHDLGVEHAVDPGIVRGLDYYTRTVFEVVHGGLGAQASICGGGRYDGLVEACGGPPTPAVGFALGMERLLITLEREGVAPPVPRGLDVFVAVAAPTGAAATGAAPAGAQATAQATAQGAAPATAPSGTEAPSGAAAPSGAGAPSEAGAPGDGARVRRAAAVLVARLRAEGLSADMDLAGRSLKAQMRYAGRYPARFVAILGEEELARGTVTLRDMERGTQEELPAEALAERLRRNGAAGAGCG